MKRSLPHHCRMSGSPRGRRLMERRSTDRLVMRRLRPLGRKFDNVCGASNNARGLGGPRLGNVQDSRRRALASFYHQIPFVNSGRRRTRSRMKLFTPLALLITLQLCAPAAQVKKETSKTAPAPAAPAVKTAFARTIVCIDPGHPSEVASGKNVQNGTSETR